MFLVLLTSLETTPREPVGRCDRSGSRSIAGVFAAQRGGQRARPGRVPDPAGAGTRPTSSPTWSASRLGVGFAAGSLAPTGGCPVGAVSGATPEPGDLLVASALLTDGVFDQTVVLVLDSDEDGALGVILNEISQTTAGVGAAGLGGGGVRAAAAVPRRAGVAERGDLPGQRGRSRARSHPAGAPCSTGSGCCTWTPRSRSSPGAYADLRIFAGYAGWSPGQLAGEVAQQMWYVVDGRLRRRLRSAPDRAVAPCCVGNAASSPSSRPGSRTRSGTEPARPARGTGSDRAHRIGSDGSMASVAPGIQRRE